jgi:hypothetical protein
VLSNCPSLFKRKPYFLVVLLIFVFMTIDYVMSPFKSHFTSVKSFLWSVLAIVLLLCDGFVFKSETIPLWQKNSFGAFMIVLVVLACVSAFGITVYVYRYQGVQQQNEKEKDPASLQKIEIPNVAKADSI